MENMNTDLDSPDRNINTPSSAVQGSPFFTYLSNLSPIKPIKSAHVAQTFSELHFPPPPAVFTSPRVSSQKELNFLRRASPKDTGEENKTFNTSCVKVKDFAVPVSDCDVPNFLSPVARQVTNLDSVSSDKIKRDDKSMATFPGCSPSKIVEQFLADPPEEGHYTVDSSKHYSKPQSPGLVEALFMGSDKLEDTITGRCEEMKEMEVISQSKSSEEFLDANQRDPKAEVSQRNEEDLSSNLEQSLKMSDIRDLQHIDQNSNGEIPNVWSHVDANHSNALMFTNDCEDSGEGVNHDENMVDQTASAFAFLLSKESNGSIEGWQKASSTDPSNVLFQKDLKDQANCSNQVGGHGDYDGTPQPPHNSFQDVNSGSNLNVKTDTELNRPMEHTSCIYKNVNQPQRGMRRRCLDFEASEARRRNLANGSWNATNLLPKPGALVTTDNDSGKNTSPSMSCEGTAISDGKQLVVYKRDAGTDNGRNSKSLSVGQLSSCSYKTSEHNSDKSDSSVRNNGHSSMSVGMPTGIGLHLNSLASSMSLNCGVGLLTTSKGAAGMQGMLTSSGVKEGPGDSRASSLIPVSSGGNISLSTNTSMSPGMLVSVVEKTRIDQQEVQSSGNTQIGVTKSTTCFRSLTVGIKPLQCRQPFKTEDINPSPLDKKRPVLQDISRQPGFAIGEEYNQSSPKKKRRKSATTGDKEGCKRCNCKKSKCLKLYCECFAAGVYCVESCTCQECFNKPEYTDMVVGTRQQIESRNPLAFAPKIVHGADSPPTDGQKECTETPASARHKRGCNCKKSMCLKKYCECYQAGVGCSDGCRCEGCKNTFGKKEGGSDDTEDKESQDEVWEKATSEEKLELVDGNDILESEQQHLKELSPLTPSFQYVGQGRSTNKLKPFGKRRFTPEDLESPSLSLSSAKPPRSPAKILRSTKGNDTAIFNHQAGSKTLASPIFTRKMENSGQFSSKWDGLADICTLTPALQPPLRPASASVNNVDGTEVSPFSGQHNEISSLNSRPFASRRSCPGGSSAVFGHAVSQSPVCTSDSIHWQTPVSAQTTPVTPTLYNSVCNVGKKLADGSDIDMRSQDVSGSAEDDTPDILKNDCSPMRGLKASSPNQKRVSPPHNYCHKEMSKRAPISSPRLKSGRKFILQSVPSFPPLTPDDVQAKD
ncbi:uncharacterized protein LOC131044154 isoform X1 [Cryptomeria japonica]|uniref:uncharacterized protein LOC131044154 isoform X1 n=1 Tax=Cryptomeria japonica TaxID=3369 RepID=UPI0027DA773F|nr:uncharacterized protein LOC131044154 isoform X1 [Cryptomeria japonica]